MTDKNRTRKNAPQTEAQSNQLKRSRQEQNVPEDQTLAQTPNAEIRRKAISTSSLVSEILSLSKEIANRNVPSLSNLLSEYDQHDASTIMPKNVDQTLFEPIDGAKRALLAAPTPSNKANAGSNGSAAYSAGDRYEEMAPLGAGGMGKVKRVRDRLLNRVLAMKVLHQHLVLDDQHVLRFIQEAQVISQLEHPNILPVHDLGVLESGEIFFTMAEIRGQSFSHYIRAYHDRSSTSADQRWNLHRLISTVNDACKAAAYAHEHGVVHRDLKPDNIMIDSFGEVLVVDWGLAKVLGDSQALESSVITTQSESNARMTMVGSIYGTPAYLAPELAAGQGATPSEQSDIYALGAILYEVLRGCPPVQGANVSEVLLKTVEGKISPFDLKSVSGNDETGLEKEPEYISRTGKVLPRSLVEAAMKALSQKPENRFTSVNEMIAIIGRWLDGTRKHELAMNAVELARSYQPAIETAETSVASLREKADRLRTHVKSWAIEETKLELWRLEDEANLLEAEARLLRVKQIQAYRMALGRKANLEPAHVALANHYLGVHQQAEQIGDSLKAKQTEVVLREHVDSLPEGHALRLDLQRYLDGTGSLTLLTEPPGARVLKSTLKMEHRRLKTDSTEEIGITPIEKLPVEMGSYILDVELDGYHPIRYPVYNQRATHVSHYTPSGELPPIEMLPLGTLSDDDCYVPAGWTILGGDPQTPNSLPRMHVWIDGFVIKRHPVTHEEYLIFLNDLVHSGELDRALIHVPREQGSTDEELGAMLYEQTENNLFVLPKQSETDARRPRQPVTMIEWRSALAYADWLANRTGLPWSLPMEFEWEKAARGTDGRFYPWGNQHDPSWSCMKDSHQGEILMQDVDAFPLDVSVYGVRGTAGNTRDWCLDKFRDAGPPLDNGQLLLPTPDDLSDQGFKSTRGGSYGNSASRARSADRDWWFPDRRYVGRGFRLAWRLSERGTLLSST